jgi:electron transfer flavoprotein alpha subunit
MAVLVFVESTNGKINKAGFEAVYYGSKIGQPTVALAFGNIDNAALGSLGNYGASKVIVARNIKNEDSQALTKFVTAQAQAENAQVIVFSFDSIGKAVAPRVAARLKAGLVAGAISLPDTASGFSVKKNVFSGKAFAEYEIKTPVKVISVMPNSLKTEKGTATAQVVENNDDFGTPKVVVKEVKKDAGDHIPLPEAEIVVSAGRGMKGPENWAMIEQLANELGAATACSRPVADIGWRPHHEHVGQTGVAIRPNLYFAIGISGAIQHLAGVNGSKVMVAINTDPEAPFFKAADYGVVGDAFQVVPKLIEAVKKFKASNH